MKIVLIFVVFSIININVYSQQTEKVKQFTGHLIIVDSLKVEKKYKNGKLKESYTKLTYKYGDNYYETKTGFHTYYDKKTGNKLLEYKYDKFGFLIRDTSYNKNGKVYKEVIATEIETSAKTIDEFLDSDKYLIITTYEKNYTGNKEGELWIFSEGKRINDKKSGLWKYYSYDKNCDLVVKEKLYK